jgi:FtsP/CotA-like multicopper oxidase with cupredoxin domain/plastocyanin
VVGLFKKEDREVLGAAWASFSLLAVVLAFVAVLVAVDANNNGSSAVPANAVQVSLSEFAISPASISVPLGGKLAVSNAGAVEHNLTISGTSLHTPTLKGGDSAVLDVKSLKTGTYSVFCSMPGHKDQGMVATLDVGGAAAASSGSGASGDGGMSMAGMGGDMTPAQNNASDAAMKKPTDAYVAQLKNGPNTKGVGNQLLSPKVLPDGTKEFDLTASIIDWQVAPGKTVKAWAYNNQVPGPRIKVNVGDKVRVVLDNKLPESTVIHFHGIEVPNVMDGVPDVTQPPVKPGQTFTYSFVAKGPAIGMYHSHHHAEHQVPDGLLGVLQVGDMPLPPNTGPVTQEVPMVLNDAGAIGLSLNGKSFPATAPVMAHVGEWVEITYMNEGLQIHPMHLHGLPQLVIAKDGYALPQPYTADTVAVAPGERYTVLVHPTADFLGPNGQPGVWAFHCHILTHAEGDKGMFGMVTTFIVTPAH